MWLVPALRFPEFSGEWEKCVLTEIVERVTRRNKGNVCKLPLTISAQYGLVDQITFFNKVIASADMSNYYLLTKGDFAYNKSYSSEYPWGAIKRLDRYEYGALSSLYICFRPLSHVSSDFLMHYFETKKWHQGVSEIAVEGARNHGLLNIGIQDFFATSHYMPQELSEQKKIAAFLNLIEKRISVQNKIIEKLETLIKGIVELAFSHAATSNTLGCYITQISQRNKTGKDLPVLSVSNKHGFVEQSEQFEDRIIASDDTSNYKIVDINDFAYNPARINVGSIARLKDKECGIVSPMYICFRTSKDILPEYLELFFKTVTFSFEVGKRLEGSVRLCLSYESLCEIVIPIISIREQQSLVKMVTTFHSKLDVEKGFLSSYQSQKQCLLSQMFI